MKPEEVVPKTEVETPHIKFIEKIDVKSPVKEMTPTEEIIDTFTKHKIINPTHEALRVI